MKKKIFISLLILTIGFIAGGISIYRSMEKGNAQLEDIITLQHIGMLREKALHNLKVVQADLLLKGSPFSTNLDNFIEHVEEMDSTISTCFECHHEPDVQERLEIFAKKVARYKKNLSRVYTIRSNEERLNQERQIAHSQGTEIVAEMTDMIAFASGRFTKKLKLARREIVNTKMLLALLLTLGPLIVLGITLFFFRDFTASLSALTKATSSLKNGNLNYRIEEQLKDEFKELSTDFNDMAMSIKDQYARMQNAERLAVVGEIAAGLAHEVRNPLAGIRLTIQFLDGKLELTNVSKTLFKEMTTELDRVENLLESLLRYARPPQPELTSVNINTVLENALQSMQYSLKGAEKNRRNKEINIISRLDENLPEINADPSQLLQVFLNLLLNAVDAIPQSGTIRAKTSKLPSGHVEVEISDTGEGIPEEQISSIFEPFFTTKTKGTGLGLAICKRLIDQQSGTVSVANNSKGGVTFTIKFPVKTETHPGQLN
ncbi:MAG: HAMP domain-containing protein [Desulfobulbaceae bacterium]|nr:HAMP domain-containing protein [Desulfobulbaceae bacterium]